MTPGPDVFVGLDVGCTTLSGGLVMPDGTVLSSIQTPTNLGSGTAVDTTLGLVADLCADAHARNLTVAAVGVGMPGLVDVDQGMLHCSVASYVAEFQHVPLAERISTKTGVAAFVDNDVNALVLGEWMFGHARGADSCVVLAIGSGIGAGIVLDGRLVRGKSGYAGELGHIPIDFEGPSCVCGGRGCLSVYVAGHWMAREARRRAAAESSSLLARVGGHMDAITAETVFAAAGAGDALAQSMVERACQALGAGIAVVVNTLNPEVVVITGGVATSLAPLGDEIIRRTRDYALAEVLAGTRIHFVPGHKSKTVRGGAALVLYERARRPAGRT